MASRLAVAFVFVLAGILVARSEGAPLPVIHSAAAIVRDQSTGEVLMAKQADVAMPIASITKLMTAMVVLDAHLNMEQTIAIEDSDRDLLRHSHSHLPVGTSLTRSQALLLALMSSENRAAHALGRTYPGGVEALVRAMNDQARALSLAETRFEDPAGLRAGNISSADDLSRLVDAASHYPEIRRCTTSTEYTLQSGRMRLQFANTNPLVRSARWQIRLSKTGYIEEGGRSLVMQTLLAKRSVLIVLLNSTGKETRIGDANRIRDWMEASLRPAPKAKRRSARALAQRT